MNVKNEWRRCDIKHFWSDIAQDNHVVQLYEDDTMLLNTLADYASDGFICGDCVVVIATSNHLRTLNDRLFARGFNLDTLAIVDQYIPVDADQMLAKFMINGRPDEKYFIQTVTELMKRARKGGTQVRAFGEMVALLWERGNTSATIQLEQLWNKFCETEAFCLFCAYPKSGFSLDASASVMHICTAHSKLIGSDENYPQEIQYKNVV
jgi:MEDS: MEthanogen/methylotroph, DcmR Sensory domain